MEDLLTVYGPLGIIVGILLIVSKQFIQREQTRADEVRAEARQFVEREQARADKERDEVTRLNTVMQDMVIPMMERSARANEAALSYLQQQEDERRFRDRMER